jgi:hypothetical protein
MFIAQGLPGFGQPSFTHRISSIEEIIGS